MEKVAPASERIIQPSWKPSADRPTSATSIAGNAAQTASQGAADIAPPHALQLMSGFCMSAM